MIILYRQPHNGLDSTAHAAHMQGQENQSVFLSLSLKPFAYDQVEDWKLLLLGIPQSNY